MLLQVIELRGTMNIKILQIKMYNSYKLTFLAPRETLYHPTVKIITVTIAAHLSCHYSCFKNVACNCVLKHHWQSTSKAAGECIFFIHMLYLYLLVFLLPHLPSGPSASQDMIWMVQGPDSVTRWVVAVINDKWYQIIIILPTGKLFPLQDIFITQSFPRCGKANIHKESNFKSFSKTLKKCFLIS